MNHQFNKLFCGLLFVFLCSTKSSTAETDKSNNKPQLKQPNIVFIFSDDHAFQAIGAYGSIINQTPRLDQLAREGMVLDRVFCANSICGPSRASVLTGKHSHINGFMRNGNRFDGDQITLSKLLQSAGYQTAMIGKWHLETDPTGFDHWEILPGQGHYYNPDFIQMDGSRQRFEGYCTDLIGDKSIEWLKNRDPNKPFLLMSQHKAPHRNWSPHPRHFGRYKLGTIPEPETLFDDYSGRSDLLKENEMSIKDHFYWQHDMKFKGPNQFPEHFLSGINNGEYQRMTEQQKQAWDAYYEPENQALLTQLAAGELSEEEVVRWKYQRYLHDYLGCVQAVDDNVGRIVDYLDQQGLAENTIVIYSSDQGFYLGEHGWYDKRWMYEESLRMPFLVRWPGVIEAGSASSALIQNIDFAPTFLEAAGLPTHESMQGKSFLPILKADQAAQEQWRDAIYYAYYENASVHNVPRHDGVRTDRYKLMYFHRTQEWNLFDLESDPKEMTSLHNAADYQSILDNMKLKLIGLRQQYQVNSAAIPETRGDVQWWRERNQAVRRQAGQGGHQVVFLGDSITQAWENAGKEVWQEMLGDTKGLNLGFSGDRTEHALWRITHDQIGPNQPKAIVLMIGTNNTGHVMQPAAETAAGVEAIIKQLRKKQPQAKILLNSVFPRGQSADNAGRIRNQQVNQLIEKFHNGEDVIYLDLTDLFLEADGTISEKIMPDFLHLSPTGYQRWADALKPALREVGVEIGSAPRP